MQRYIFRDKALVLKVSLLRLSLKFYYFIFCDENWLGYPSEVYCLPSRLGLKKQAYIYMIAG